MSLHDKTRGIEPRAFLAGLWSSAASRPWKEAIFAGIGGFAAIFLLSTLSNALGALLLIAPFGATSVLVFAIPQSPLARPRNVIGGHLISTFVGLCVFKLLGATPLALGLGVGLAIAAMSLSETLHPPAGADPIVVILGAASWQFLFTPVLVGASAIVLIAALFHRLITAKPYSLGSGRLAALLPISRRRDSN
jgi:CBS-domain-containing membrane protein